MHATVADAPEALSGASEGVPPAASPADPDLDDEELDRRWGLSSAEPLVGFGAPPVVAVMVTADPGDWFEQTLESVADQDYESLEVLVIDNGGSVDPTPRIAEVLPTAFVKRLEDDRGFSAAANEVLGSVEGAAFYLFLHDDVRLAPGAVTAMVAEAFRSTAGVVGPKLVEWDDPTRLASVGAAVDPYGFASSFSEPGELDQSQHDLAREVFAVSDACMLVRSDLFAAVGGFDEKLPYFGQDMDLCWRVHVAAGSVYFCPTATVAHRSQFQQRRPTDDSERVLLRHQARSMLTNYEPFRLLWVLPIAAALSLIDLVGSALLGRFQRAVDIVAAWGWNLVNAPSLLRARSRVKRIRSARDVEYLPLMRQGSSRLSDLVRADENEGRLQAAATAGRGYVRQLTSESHRAGVGLAVLCLVLVAIGARGLLVVPLPVMREFVGMPDSGGALLAQWWSGWRDAGFGEASLPPNVVPGIGLLSTVLLGSIGLARRLLLVAPLLIGALGAWKLFVATGSLRTRAAAFAAYALAPVALNAIAEGRLQALVTYAAAPWLLRRVARQAGLAPFADGTPAPPVRRQLAGTALLMVVVGAVTPLGLAILVVVVGVMAAVHFASGRRRAAGSMASSTLLGLLCAAPVLAPWIVSAGLRGDAGSLTGLWVGRGATPSGAQILVGDVGAVGVSLFGFGLLVAAAYALTSARSWRLTWSLAGWATALCAWGAAILLARMDALAGAGIELVLVPAALGLAVSVAMGALAFERDVIGSDFGLQQILSGVAAVALLVSLVPIAVASTNGRWYLPEGDFDRVLALVDETDDVRAVWIGDPDVLPSAGWPLPGVPGLSVAVTSGLAPTVTERYRLEPGEGVEQLIESLDAAMRGETSRLGRVLGPMGIGYVVMVDRPVPQPYAATEVPLPTGSVAALSEQLDLSEIEGVNPAMVLFEVEGTWPLRADLSESVDELVELSSPADLLQAGPASPPAVLGRGPGTRFEGAVPAGSTISQSVPSDPGWSLEVDGARAQRSELLGWQQQFRVDDGGDGTLSWTPPWWTRVAQLVQVVGLAALLLAARRRTSLVSPRAARRSNRGEQPIVVLTPEGEVLSAEQDVSGGAAARDPGGASTEEAPS